jgi:lysophospholipase L1-like esterase
VPACGEQPDPSVASSDFLDPAGVAGREMTEERARWFFPPLRNPTGRMMYDREAWVVLRPDREQSFAWAEHPAGRVTFRTNNLGFREDEPTVVRTDAHRILVVGDSHTEGLVENAESFANVLEDLLDEAHPERRHDVINAAVGGTGPHNYLGMVRRHLALKPDLVIAVVYTGNDFSNALEISDFHTKRRVKPRDEAYIALVSGANERWPELLPQGFNQVCQFRYWEGDEDVALAAAAAALREIAALGSRHGFRLAVVALPSKPDVDRADDAQVIDAIETQLGYGERERTANLLLGRRLLAELDADGILGIDPSDAMQAETRPLYWRKDHHLDVTGHALLARIVRDGILDLVRAAEPRRGGPAAPAQK